MSAPPRASHRINRRQADNFFPAIRFAEQQGRPLNLHITLNFAHTDCEPQHVSAAFEKLRDNHFTRWLRYCACAHPHYGPPTYVWVVENHGGDTHVHWAVHVPKPMQREFGTKLRRWLARVAGAVTCEASAIYCQPIPGPRGLGKYMMKGIDPRYAAFYHVRHEAQGIVYGKRCGISESLGPRARRRDHRAAA